jgi:hypothetical protein
MHGCTAHWQPGTARTEMWYLCFSKAPCAFGPSSDHLIGDGRADLALHLKGKMQTKHLMYGVYATALVYLQFSIRRLWCAVPWAANMFLSWLRCQGLVFHPYSTPDHLSSSIDLNLLNLDRRLWPSLLLTPLCTWHHCFPLLIACRCCPLANVYAALREEALVGMNSFTFTPSVLSFSAARTITHQVDTWTVNEGVGVGPTYCWTESLILSGLWETNFQIAVSFLSTKYEREPDMLLQHNNHL